MKSTERYTHVVPDGSAELVEARWERLWADSES